MMPPPSLQYRVRLDGARAVLRLTGELSGEDWTDPLLIALTEHYINDGVRQIEVDLSSLSFIDLEGVASLLRLRGEARVRHKSFLVSGASGRVKSKLEQAGDAFHVLQCEVPAFR
jgi:anti-anti-sigma regulatory factor